MTVRLFPYSLAIKSFIYIRKRLQKLTISHLSSQIFSGRVAEAVRVSAHPIPVLCIALVCRAVELASFHSTQIHFGSRVCFSVNQLPIHSINLSSLFYIKVSSLEKQGSISYFQTCCLSYVGRIPSSAHEGAEGLLIKGKQEVGKEKTYLR